MACGDFCKEKKGKFSNSKVTLQFLKYAACDPEQHKEMLKLHQVKKKNLYLWLKVFAGFDSDMKKRKRGCCSTWFVWIIKNPGRGLCREGCFFLLLSSFKFECSGADAHSKLTHLTGSLACHAARAARRYSWACGLWTPVASPAPLRRTQDPKRISPIITGSDEAKIGTSQSGGGEADVWRQGYFIFSAFFSLFFCKRRAERNVERHQCKRQTRLSITLIKLHTWW